MSLPAPRRYDVVPDVPPGFGQLRGEPVPDDQRAQVVLAGDVPENGRWHAPPRAHRTAFGHVGIEVLAGWPQPVRRRFADQAIGLLAHEVGRPHRDVRPRQPGRPGKMDHPSSLPGESSGRLAITGASPWRVAGISW